MLPHMSRPIRPLSITPEQRTTLQAVIQRPTASSCMNLVERFFRDLTRDVVRHGSFNSVRELVDAIDAYLDEHNLNPQAIRLAPIRTGHLG